MSREAAAPEVELRLGEPGDVEGIAALIERENHRAADREMVARRLAGLPSVVALQDGELVGFFYGRHFAPEIAELQNMLVARRIRSRGIGRRMVAMLEEALREAGYRVAIGANSLLHPQASPERCMKARAFWLHMGWHIALATGGTVLLVRWLGPHAGHADAAPAAVSAHRGGRTLCGLSPAPGMRGPTARSTAPPVKGKDAV